VGSSEKEKKGAKPGFEKTVSWYEIRMMEHCKDIKTEFTFRKALEMIRM